MGKSSVIKHLLATHPDKVAHPLTYTTRSIRAGEVNGRDMHFIPRSQFTPRLLGGEYLAYTEYDKEWYGTLKQDILDIVHSGKRAIVAFDESGVDCLKYSGFPAFYIYLVPPSLDHIATWLSKRWPEGGEAYLKRCNLAQQEFLRFERDGEFRKKFDCYILSSTIESMATQVAQLMGLLCR